MRITIFVVLVALSVCSASSGSNNAQKEPLLILSAFKLVGENDTILLEMSETGRIRRQMQEIGLIDILGLVYDESGRLVARLRDNDFLENVDGKPLVKVGTDGTLDNGSGVPIYWSEDGILVRGKETLGIRMLPRNSPARRAASIVLFLYLASDGPQIVPSR
ncbi:MAG: hypothetical protein ABSH17_01400 [Syntrophobacteraceae bacterium]|jgi:hypothetical protein